MKASEVLQAALAKLDGGKKWHQGSGYRTANGDNTQHRYLNVVAMCSSAAIIDSEPDEFRHFTISPAWQYLQRVVGKTSIPDWNDASQRKFPEVKSKFLKAIALAEADGN